jgi:hypothetical protein
MAIAQIPLIPTHQPQDVTSALKIPAQELRLNRTDSNRT